MMHRLFGVWKLAAAQAFDEKGAALPAPFGPHPMGIMLFEAQRMIGVIGDGRVEVATDATPRVYFSYAGSYVFDGERLVTRVDGASSPDGFQDQIRHVTFQSPDRILVVPLSPILSRSSGLQLIWERVA